MEAPFDLAEDVRRAERAIVDFNDGTDDRIAQAMRALDELDRYAQGKTNDFEDESIASREVEDRALLVCKYALELRMSNTHENRELLAISVSNLNDLYYDGPEFGI